MGFFINASLGGFAPGSGNVIENSYVKIDCSKTTAIGSGNTLTISWNITFKPSFVGSKNAYLYINDLAGGYQGWISKGTWTITGTNQPPQVGTITPSSGSSQSNTAVNFATTYIDANGYQDITTSYLLINTDRYTNYGLYAYYDSTANKLYMGNDSSVWIGGYAPGSSYIIENSWIKLDCSKTTVSGSGTTQTINWNITFKSTLSGTKNCYLNATDKSYAQSGWTQKGTWTIQ